ncbi:MAG TPA: FecR domain-containing protein [bacterium]|nr:FecR domain-containing protein [bacterium]
MKKNVILAMLFFFNIFAFASAAQSKEDPLVDITVEKGDCLIRICQKYIENPNQWKKIADINKMKNPDLILPGQTILFPASMMKGTPVAGIVTFIKGSADFKMPGSEEWKPLGLKDKVVEGALVRTGEESSMEIRFEDGNTFLLHPNTTIGLKTARKSGDSYSKYKMSISMGKLISNVQKSTGKESTVQIEAPTAILGVRGTVFRSYVAPDGTTKFEVLEGEVVVEGQKKTVEVKKGEGTIVREGEPPIKPKKLLRPPALTEEAEYLYKKFPVKFFFDRVEGAVSYRIVLAKDREAKDIVREQVKGIQEIFEISDVEDGTYFMQASSIDEIGLEGPPSETIKVNIRVNPVPPFVEIPVDRAGYKAQFVRCKWLNVRDSEKYRVQISEDIGFKRIVRDEKELRSTEYNTGNLEYRGYYFRVSSVAADGYQGEWSDVLSFSLIPPPAAPPVEAPEIDKKEIRIRWQNLGKDIRYHFQMSGEEEFQEVAVDRKLEVPETVLEKPVDPGTYYVRTSGIDSAGREGSFSKPQTFIVIPPPAAPLVEMPEVGKNEVYIRWQNLGKDIRYHFQMSGEEGFQEVAVDRRLEVPEAVFEKPRNPGTYYIRVRGINSDDREGPFSNLRKFEIRRSTFCEAEKEFLESLKKRK